DGRAPRLACCCSDPRSPKVPDSTEMAKCRPYIGITQQDNLAFRKNVPTQKAPYPGAPPNLLPGGPSLSNQDSSNHRYCHFRIPFMDRRKIALVLRSLWSRMQSRYSMRKITYHSPIGSLISFIPFYQ